MIIPELGNLEAELEAKELTSRAVDPMDIIPADYVQRGATITCRYISSPSVLSAPFYSLATGRDHSLSHQTCRESCLSRPVSALATGPHQRTLRHIW